MQGKKMSRFDSRNSSGSEEDRIEEKKEDEMDEDSSSSLEDPQQFERQLSFSFQSQLLSSSSLLLNNINNNNDSSSSSSSPSDTATNDDHRIPVLPCDIVVHQIGSFVNDPKTLYSMACVNRAWRQSLRSNLLSSPVIWHRLYLHRWMRSLSAEASDRPTTFLPSTMPAPSNAGTEGQRHHQQQQQLPEKNWKRLYRQRHSRDKAVVELVREVAESELSHIKLTSSTTARAASRSSSCHSTFHDDNASSSMVVDSVTIHHARWRRLIGNSNHHNPTFRPRYWMMDVLCAIANQETEYLSILGVGAVAAADDNVATTTVTPQQRQVSTTSFVISPWERFLAASAVFQFHCHEIVRHLLHTWEQAASLLSSPTATTSAPSSPRSAQSVSSRSTSSGVPLLPPPPPPPLLSYSSLYEETAIVLAHAMRPLPDLLQRSSTMAQMRTKVQQLLTTMTHRVVQFMQYFCQTSSSSSYRRTHYSCSCQDPRVILYTIHYVMTKQYRLAYQPTQLKQSQEDTPAQRFAACSIFSVLSKASASLHGASTAPQQQQLPPPQQQPCHPMLLTVIFQGVARRMGIQSDTVTCCSHQCRTMVRVPVPSYLSGGSSSPASVPSRIPQRPSPPRTPPPQAGQASPQRSSPPSPPTPPLPRPYWFVDLHQGPGHILTTMTQCQEWLTQYCQETSAPPPQQQSQANSPSSVTHVVPNDDEEEEEHEGRYQANEENDDDDDLRSHGQEQQHQHARDDVPPLHQMHPPPSSAATRLSWFWSQPPMEVTSMLSWLAMPLLVSTNDGDDVNPEEHDSMAAMEPYQVLLRHLVKGMDNNDDDSDSNNDADDDLLAVMQDRILLFPSMLRYCQVIKSPQEA